MPGTTPTVLNVIRSAPARDRPRPRRMSSACHHGVVVVQRLTHAHEHKVAEACGWMKVTLMGYFGLGGAEERRARATWTACATISPAVRWRV